MVSVKESSEIRFLQTEVKMEFPLSTIPHMQRLISFPLLGVIFVMGLSLPLTQMGESWSGKVPVWPFLIEWSILSPLLLCIFAVGLSKLCSRYGMNVSLMAENLFGSSASKIIHLVLIGAVLVPLVGVAINMSDTFIHVTNAPDDYIYVFTAIALMLFALPALFGISTFIGFAIFWIPTFLVLTIWVLNRDLANIIFPEMGGMSSLTLTKWLSFQSELGNYLLPVIFLVANIARFSEEPAIAGRVTFLGLLMPIVLLLVLGGILKLAIDNASLVSLFKQQGSLIPTVLFILIPPILLADKAFYTASLSMCVLFRSQARRRCLYLSFVLVLLLTAYTFFVAPIVSDAVIVFLLAPLLSSLVTVGYLNREKLDKKEPAPKVRWTAILGLFSAWVANYFLPFDTLVQGLGLGIVFPLIFYVFRKHEKEAPKVIIKR